MNTTELLEELKIAGDSKYPNPEIKSNVYFELALRGLEEACQNCYFATSKLARAADEIVATDASSLEMLGAIDSISLACQAGTDESQEIVLPESELIDV
ncbi:TPA: hypothetical protein EYO12_01555 [Candidatus Saccharibacteria bacterium]|nr:hypothetical protein [Candidatus Saccharibacteria bacterium]HIO87402.1 hypothetical protein [Candidatus Saccharibacteria bacterium]